jgi:hypothetical protein
MKNKKVFLAGLFFRDNSDGWGHDMLDGHVAISCHVLSHNNVASLHDRKYTLYIHQDQEWGSTRTYSMDDT